MTTLDSLSVAQLREAIAVKEQIEQLETQLASLFGERTTPKVADKKRRGMSAASRARMSAAARARWAKIKATKPKTKKRRKMSAEGRARISAAAKARWKKAKAAGRTTL
jgi:CTP:molybdopterin cytidylyltransferase MocA